MNYEVLDISSCAFRKSYCSSRGREKQASMSKNKPHILAPPAGACQFISRLGTGDTAQLLYLFLFLSFFLSSSLVSLYLNLKEQWLGLRLNLCLLEYGVWIPSRFVSIIPSLKKQPEKGYLGIDHQHKVDSSIRISFSHLTLPYKNYQGINLSVQYM